jgi:hypothetical protein
MRSEEIQKQGANARAMGLTQFDCPYFKPDQVPVATGESVESSNAKVEAWNLGWQIEDAMRSSSPPDRPDRASKLNIVGLSVIPRV